MKLPIGGMAVNRVGGNYSVNGTEAVQDPGALAFDYVVPTGYELWLKSFGVLPNTAAQSNGQFRFVLGDADTGPGGEYIPAILTFDFDFALLVNEGGHVSMYIWSTSPTVVVGAQASFFGMLYPHGTYARMVG